MNQKKRKTFVQNSMKEANILINLNAEKQFKDFKEEQLGFYEDLTDQQFISELMSDSDLSRITFTMFEKKIKD